MKKTSPEPSSTTSKSTPSASPKTGSKASRAPFVIGDERIPGGQLQRLELPVARLPTGSRLSIPVAVAHGRVDGPCVWLSAAVHGDELNGIPIVRSVSRSIDPRTLVGTVIFVPVVNVFGLITESRYLPDRRDLNRSFPGSSRGSLAAQLAHLFMTEVVRHCELGIDIHSGSGGRTNLPQIRCDLEDEATRDAAHLFGAPITVHSSLRDGSLREAARAVGSQVLLYETGEAGRFDREGIALGIDGSLRVLGGLGMRPDDPVPSPAMPGRTSHKSVWGRTRRAGFCDIHVRLGDIVEEGQAVASVFDVLSPKDQPVAAPCSGMVIGHRVEALVNRGDAVVHVARLDD